VRWSATRACCATDPAPAFLPRASIAAEPTYRASREVAKHKTEKDCRVIIKGNVYDVTKFLPDHPGGKKAILMYAGKDATSEFEMLHKPDIIVKYGASFKKGPVA